MIKKDCKIIDFACPFDSRIGEREKDKMRAYNDLKTVKENVEYASTSDSYTIVIGALEQHQKKLGKDYKT